jgi:drug/metabolite transporter (DMT)-like permease
MAHSDGNLWSVYISLAVASFIYGGWALVAKEVTSRHIPLLVFAFYRCVGGALILLLALWFCPSLGLSGTVAEVTNRGTKFEDVARFVLLGALTAGNVCGFILAASQLPAITCSICQPTVPVIAMCVSALCGVECMTRVKLASILLSVMGAILVIYFGAHPDPRHDAAASTTGRNHNMLGLVAITLNVTCAAIYFVFQKAMLKTYSPVLITASTYAIAAGIVFATACATSGLDLAAWSMGGDHVAWACVAYAASLTTALNYSILAWANKNTSPTTVTTSATLQPVAAVCLSWFLLGIPLSAAQALGGCCIASVLLVYVNSLGRETAAASTKLLK